MLPVGVLLILWRWGFFSPLVGDANHSHCHVGFVVKNRETEMVGSFGVGVDAVDDE